MAAAPEYIPAWTFDDFMTFGWSEGHTKKTITQMCYENLGSGLVSNFEPVKGPQYPF